MPIEVRTEKLSNGSSEVSGIRFEIASIALTFMQTTCLGHWASVVIVHANAFARVSGVIDLPRCFSGLVVLALCAVARDSCSLQGARTNFWGKWPLPPYHGFENAIARILRLGSKEKGESGRSSLIRHLHRRTYQFPFTQPARWRVPTFMPPIGRWPTKERKSAQSCIHTTIVGRLTVNAQCTALFPCLDASSGLGSTSAHL